MINSISSLEVTWDMTDMSQRPLVMTVLQCIATGFNTHKTNALRKSSVCVKHETLDMYWVNTTLICSSTSALRVGGKGELNMNR